MVFTNDKNPPSSTLSGAHVGKYAQIGAAATLMPGIEIGENAMIGAGSVVTKNVAPFTLVAGNPAVVLKKLHPENYSENGSSSNAWMYHFERGMPWEGIGFDNWKRGNKE